MSYIGIVIEGRGGGVGAELKMCYSLVGCGSFSSSYSSFLPPQFFSFLPSLPHIPSFFLLNFPSPFLLSLPPPFSHFDLIRKHSCLVSFLKFPLYSFLSSSSFLLSYSLFLLVPLFIMFLHFSFFASLFYHLSRIPSSQILSLTLLLLFCYFPFHSCLPPASHKKIDKKINKYVNK